MSSPPTSPLPAAPPLLLQPRCPNPAPSTQCLAVLSVIILGHRG
jgi:hypothetical protein